MNSNEPSLTAFPRTEAVIRDLLADAPIHVHSLRRPLRRCDLERCKGMCCYDGIYLDDEEADVVAELARTEADFFSSLGLRLPEQVVVHGSWENLISGKKTAVVPWSGARAVAGFPAHFNATACVFHLDDGRCALQVLSVARGRHPWYYKPTGCWLHPLTTDRDNRPGLGLHDDKTDPCQAPGYPGFITSTFCGASPEQGDPAYEVLREELDLLGRIAGRDLYAEEAALAAPGRRSLRVLPRSDSPP
jgi:hypothetical protein